MTDERIERVSKALYTVHRGRVDDRPLSWETFADREPRLADEYRDEARAALAALDDELRSAVKNDLHLEREANRNYPEWHVWLDEIYEGTGPTVDAAIRQAVQHAQEGE